jgi:hypothetical protein
MNGLSTSHEAEYEFDVQSDRVSLNAICNVNA